MRLGKSHEGLSKYTVAITVLTFLYLVVELGFNARLLDVAGSLASKDEITSIERWGRIISGVAVTLFAWGSLIFPLASKGAWTLTRLALWMTVSGVTLTSLTYIGEKSLIDRLVDRSSPTERESAAKLRLVAHAVLTGVVKIDGVDLSDQELKTPEGKTFLALFPFLAESTENLQTKISASLPIIARSAARETLGDASSIYNEAYRASISRLRDSYNRYVDLQGGAVASVAVNNRNPAELWQQYRNRLEERMHTTPDQVPPYAWRRVGNEVRSMGIPVPMDWNPQDYRRFSESVMAPTVSATVAANAKRAPVDIQFPPGLSWSQFITQPPIQSSWKDTLTCGNASIIKPSLRATMSLGEFQKFVYEPLVVNLAAKQLDPFNWPARAYGDGGAAGSLGRTAMQALLVPPIALLFSLIGALTHIFKSIKYLFSLWRKSLIQDMIVGIAVVSIALSAFISTNAVSQSTVFRYFLNRTSKEVGPIAAVGVQWVVKAQPYAYPVNELVRVHFLLGFTFERTPSSTTQNYCEELR